MSPREVKVNFVKSGMGIEEGTVVRWVKKIGEQVKESEVVLEIETAKALQEVEAPVSGTLTKVMVAEGETIPVNTPLGLIEPHND